MIMPGLSNTDGDKEFIKARFEVTDGIIQTIINSIFILILQVKVLRHI